MNNKNNTIVQRTVLAFGMAMFAMLILLMGVVIVSLAGRTLPIVAGIGFFVFLGVWVFDWATDQPTDK